MVKIDHLYGSAPFLTNNFILVISLRTMLGISWGKGQNFENFQFVSIISIVVGMSPFVSVGFIYV